MIILKNVIIKLGLKNVIIFQVSTPRKVLPMRGIASSHPDSENTRKWTLRLNQTTTTRGREKWYAEEKILLYVPTLNTSEGVGNETTIM